MGSCFFLYLTNSSLLAIIYFLTVYLPLSEIFWASWVVLLIKNFPVNARDIRDAGSIPGQEDSLDKGMATHSSILIWRIPWTEEPNGLQSIGSHKVGHH